MPWPTIGWPTRTSAFCWTWPSPTRATRTVPRPAEGALALTVALDRPGTSDPRLTRRGIRREAATVTWNVVEAALALTAGLAVGSVALTGFGLDSAIEIAAAGPVLTRIRSGPSRKVPGEPRERRALRAKAVTFVALAGFLLVDGIITLRTGSRPERSSARSPGRTAHISLSSRFESDLVRVDPLVICTEGSCYSRGCAGTAWWCALEVFGLRAPTSSGSSPAVWERPSPAAVRGPLL